MVNPLEIMPILAMAFAIAAIPILSDGPFKGDRAAGRKRRSIHLPHPGR